MAFCERRTRTTKQEEEGSKPQTAEGREEHCSLSEAPHPVAWRRRAQQMVHNLIRQPGTSIPSLGSRMGLAGPLSSRPLLVLKGGVPCKGLALLNQLCTKAARPNCCQIQALVGMEGVSAPQDMAGKPGSVWASVLYNVRLWSRDQTPKTNSCWSSSQVRVQVSAQGCKGEWDFTANTFTANTAFGQCRNAALDLAAHPANS